MTLIVFYLFIKKVMSFKLCVWKEDIKYKFNSVFYVEN